MTAGWTAAELGHIEEAEELHIAARRADGTWRRPVPIWAVSVDGQVYVRTWHRRETGWFGSAVASHRARISVPGVQADVAVEDVGEGGPELRAGIDAAYLAKYAHYGRSSVDRMVAADAVAATLRLRRDA